MLSNYLLPNHQYNFPHSMPEIHNYNLVDNEKRPTNIPLKLEINTNFSVPTNSEKSNDASQILRSKNPGEMVGGPMKHRKRNLFSKEQNRELDRLYNISKRI